MTLFISILWVQEEGFVRFYQQLHFCKNASHALFSIGVHFRSQSYITFYENSVHIQPTLPHSKRNMEPPTKNTPFEEENLPTPKTNMSIEHPPFTKMYFLLKNGEIFQCHV